MKSSDRVRLLADRLDSMHTWPYGDQLRDIADQIDQEEAQLCENNLDEIRSLLNNSCDWESAVADIILNSDGPECRCIAETVSKIVAKKLTDSAISAIPSD